MDVPLLVESGELAMEGIGDVLPVLAEQPILTAEEAVGEAGLAGVGDDEVRETVAEVVERNAEQAEEEGMGVFSVLIGEAMGALRGKADGEQVRRFRSGRGLVASVHRANTGSSHHQSIII
jgi:glutamyl-tRNA(Gln) amidotransferase subunit E